jgi:hypothetical protein
MRSMLVALFALAAVAVAAPRSDFVNGDMSVQFVGSSAQFKVFKTGAKDFFKVKFGKIAELEADGKQKRSISLPSQPIDYTVAAGELGDADNVTTITMAMNTDLGGAGSCSGGLAVLNITVYIVPTDVEVPYGNSTIQVKSRSIKFDVSSSAWPFCSTDNSLSVQMTLVNRVSTSKGKSSRMRGGGKKVTLGPASMDMPEIAIIDGVQEDINITVAPNGKALQLIFPYFSESLNYDPTVGLDDGSDDSAFFTGVAGGCVALLAAVFLGSLRNEE